MHETLQFDPALKELLLRRTGSRLGEVATDEAAAELVPVVVRLTDPAVPVEPLRVVSRFGPVVTGRVPLGRLVELRTHPNVASLKASQSVVPGLAVSVPEIRAAPDSLRTAGVPGFTGRGVVVGVVDWGCDFAHRNFRDAAGRTRLLWLWDQRGGRRPESPAPFDYGREIGRAEIEAALTAPDPYAALGYDPADADAGGHGAHGTHVLDIAAGSGLAPGAAPGVAPEADLVFVHLRGDDTHPHDTLGDSVRLLEAVRYIVDRAGDRPVVVNLSLGRTGGAHDATPPVVQGLDELLGERPGRAVLMSTGNYFTARLHAHGRLRAGERVDLPWLAMPRNDEVAELEVWYPGGDAFSLELIDPLGRKVARVGPGEDRVVREGGRIRATLYHRLRDPNNGDNQINVFLWEDAPVGTWMARLRGERVSDGAWHAWIEREDPAFQSRFAGGIATPVFTTGTICNGRRTIAVGAYDARHPSRPIVPFSSAGPTRDGRLKPDVSAPGGGIRAAKSSYPLPDGGRFMHGTTVKSGTSMAAPHVAGVVALMFEAAGSTPLWAEQVGEILRRTARRGAAQTGIARLRYGSGAVDAAAAVAAVLKLTRQEKGAPPVAGPAGFPVQSPDRAGGEVMPMPMPIRSTGEPALKRVAEPRCSRCSGEGWEASTLPHGLLEAVEEEISRTDPDGAPTYDREHPLWFAPTGRTLPSTEGRFHYHAANLVYNAAHRSGYPVPMLSRSGAASSEAATYPGAASTFDALTGRLGDSARDYFLNFFEVVAPPGAPEVPELQPGDLLLRGAQPERPYGHIAVVVDPTVRTMDDPYFLGRDALSGRGVHCIDAGLALHPREDHFGRVLTDEEGRVLPTRMVVRLRPGRSPGANSSEAATAPATGDTAGAAPAGSTVDLDAAVRLNRRYSASLGWHRHLERIVRELGFTDRTPGEHEFAEAVARWQGQNGLSADGALGPRSWSRMAARLGVGREAPAAPAAAHAPFFKDAAHLRDAPLQASPALVVDRAWPNTRKVLARTYNRLGGLMRALAGELGVDTAAVLAVWQVESGGREHRVGHCIIRFENHYLFKRWGKLNPEAYDRHFRHGGRGGVEGARWENHQFREDPTKPFEPVHSGRQATEYRALELAKRLAGEAVALECISMGGPQIMGAHYRDIGYASPREMFDAFQAGERAHVLGFFDFCRTKRAPRPGDLLRALASLDWRSFAAGYNGTEQVEKYAGRLEANHTEALRLALPGPGAGSPAVPSGAPPVPAG